jgi:catechol 2,3-dioxygenase-like lactoylglutathione lyase family enzyme
MKILRVESIIYGAEDVEKGVQFFQDWGLKKAGPSSFTLPSGQTVEVKPAGDASLPKAPVKGSTVREVIWGVDNDASLAELKQELSRDREVRTDADGSLHTYDDMGFGIGFRKSAAAPAAAAAKADRMNKPFDPPRSASPIRIGHVVYNIPRDGQQKAADFYTKRLQFRMTDHTGDLGDFMRCNGSNDHHNLFLLTPPNHAAFNHAAFEVRDFDEIIFGGKNMRAKGWKAFAPPGRHILGSNLFWYFQNPAGGQVEYFADMDVMDDEFKTRNWEKSPGYAMWQLEMPDTEAAAAPPR